MKNSKRLSHVIRKGDNLYQIARHYHTTVPMILASNPKIDPYNLKAGNVITISPGSNFAMSQKSMPQSTGHSASPDPSAQFALISNMRNAWEQQVYWTHTLLVSILERLNDEQDVIDRVLMNPADIAAIFSNYYNADTVNTIEELLTEHLQIGVDFITAMRDEADEADETNEAEELRSQWYINADQMAEDFSNINPYYNFEEIHKMLYNHLGLIVQKVTMRRAGSYASAFDAVDAIEIAALEMADYLSQGIIKQFPQNF